MKGWQGWAGEILVIWRQTQWKMRQRKWGNWCITWKSETERRKSPFSIWFLVLASIYSFIHSFGNIFSCAAITITVNRLHSPGCAVSSKTVNTLSLSLRCTCPFTLTRSQDTFLFVIKAQQGFWVWVVRSEYWLQQCFYRKLVLCSAWVC